MPCLIIPPPSVESEIVMATAYTFLFFVAVIPCACLGGWLFGLLDDYLSRWYDKYLRHH